MGLTVILLQCFLISGIEVLLKATRTHHLLSKHINCKHLTAKKTQELTSKHCNIENYYRCACPDLVGLLEIFCDFRNPRTPLSFLPLSHQKNNSVLNAQVNEEWEHLHVLKIKIEYVLVQPLFQPFQPFQH